VFKQAWRNNKGVFLILLAQATGSTMDAIVRFLQQGGHGMHPFQVIFARMSITALLSTVYMWYNKVPDFPLGAPAVRGWLILRALAGFFGLFCLYCKTCHVSSISLYKILM
jgi:drug/metabolite transporter (DMT)-like permease